MSEVAPIAAVGDDHVEAESRGIIRTGNSFLSLDRFDACAIILLIAFAFILRMFSPVFVTSSGLHVWTVRYPVNTAECEPGVPGYKGQACGFVFDEVYFPVDALKDLKDIDYFDPEPPLAKLLIAPSIWAFGFNTLGWRFTSVIAGSLLVGLVYLLAKRLKKDRFFALASGLFVCFDGLAFVESRVGVIDVIAIMLATAASYLFLLHWSARTRVQWRATLYRFATVVGLAMAAKVTALAPLALGAALSAARWCIPWIERRFHFRPEPRAGAAALLWRSAAGRRAWVHYLGALFLFAAVIVTSYSRYVTIPHQLWHYTGCTNQGGLVGYSYSIPKATFTIDGVEFINPIVDVADVYHQFDASLNYHVAECQPHPYASPWYTWPALFRPVLYYYPGTPLPRMITNMGNPALWWLALPALLFVAWEAVRPSRRRKISSLSPVRLVMGGLKFTAEGISSLSLLRFATLCLGAISIAAAVLAFHFGEQPPLKSVHVHAGVVFDLAMLGIFCLGALLLAWIVFEGRFVPGYIILSYLVGWFMWAPGNSLRILFLYHMLIDVPFMAMGLAYALTALRKRGISWHGNRYSGAPIAYATVILVVVAFLFFYPIWTGIPQSLPDENLRIWLSSWLYGSY